MKATRTLILAAIWLCPQAGFAAAIPDCAGPVDIAAAPVIRVERSGVLVLGQGRAVTLEGILLPQGGDNEESRLLADRAFVTLARLADAGPVTFAATPPLEDRYGRLRAQGFGAEWLQRVLLERGLARVMIAPDRTACAAELYAAEARARDARRGLWALPAYRIRVADAALADDIGSFQIVEGVVANVGRGDGRSFIDFSMDWRNGFSAVVAGEDRKTFRREGFDLAGLRGRRIRLRGMVRSEQGRPQIVLANPAQIELLDKP
jgi:hypothetical protein